MHARHRHPASLVVAGLVCTTLAAHAESHITPGLWEEQVSVKSDVPGANDAMAQLHDKLAAMSPEQRKSIEQMMASHGLGAGSTTNSVRVCITKEQADLDTMPDRNGHCTRKEVTRSGNVVKFNFACDNGHGPVTGDGTMTLNSSTSFNVVTNADMTMSGKPAHMHSEATGTFVSSDCGSVKPMPSH